MSELQLPRIVVTSAGLPCDNLHWLDTAGRCKMLSTDSGPWLQDPPVQSAWWAFKPGTLAMSIKLFSRDCRPTTIASV